MKTYLVFYLLGKIIFTLGPYPDGADDVCKTSAVELQAKSRDEFWSEFQTVTNVPIDPIDLIVKCVHAETRPVITQ